jgi:concanavalin A-like lectin/glucanase superfamily protein/Big-like domain-containing protein
VSGLVNKYVAGSFNGYQLFFNNGNLCAWYLRDTTNYVYDGGACPLSTGGYNDGLWHHAAFVVDSSGGRLYVDGVAKGVAQPWTGQSGAPTTVQDVQLGHYPGVSGGFEYLAGTVDELRIYGQALSASDALQVYNNSKPANPDTIPPVASLTAPLAGQTLAGSIVVSASASDNVGMVGLQFRLDGSVLGAELMSPPYSLSWNTALAANGSHALTAVARDAAGNSAASAAVTVTVSNNPAPVISSVSAAGVSSSAATLSWTTNMAADSQVEYGPTGAYGSSTTLDASLVVPHSQGLSALVAGTLYHYRVKSRSGAGTLAASADFTFTTPTPGTDPSLVAYLKFDEGSGATAADASGHGFAGALTNGATWTAGRSGQAAALDGVNDYVGIPHGAALDAFPLTASVWFKTSSTTGVKGLLNKYVAGSFNGYQLFFNNGNLCAWYLTTPSSYVYDGGSCTLSTAGYNDGLWHQAVFVVDASGGRLYVDGAQKGSRAWTGLPGKATTAQDVHLGHYPGVSGTPYLPGAVDEVRIYSRALSASEVLQLYQGQP